jgi:hypothetical protein
MSANEQSVMDGDHEAAVASSAETEVHGIEEMPSEPEPEIPVHPFAASFPMIEGEEFEDFVDDIRSRGLLHPIVLDKTGQLIDGRNRLRACKLANVEPKFTTFDGDSIAYILAANVTRRHLTKGQQAMAYAKAYPEGENPKGGRGKENLPVTGNFRRELLRQARFVLRWTPDQANQVMEGASLEEAYRIASDQKREQEDYEAARSVALEYLDSIASICARVKSDAAKPAFLDKKDFLQSVRDEVTQIIAYATQLKESL